MKLFKRKERPMQEETNTGITFHEPSPIWLKMREEAKNRTPEEQEEMVRQAEERLKELTKR